MPVGRARPVNSDVRPSWSPRNLTLGQIEKEMIPSHLLDSISACKMNSWPLYFPHDCHIVTGEQRPKSSSELREINHYRGQISMTAKKIQKHLEQALLHNGHMRNELYEYELEELLDEWKSSMAEDNDDFIFAVTEHSGDVAMVLIEKSGQVHTNERAREKLKAFWTAAYDRNMKKLIPTFARQLNSGEIAVSGVKVVQSP